MNKKQTKNTYRLILSLRFEVLAISSMDPHKYPGVY